MNPSSVHRAPIRWAMKTKPIDGMTRIRLPISKSHIDAFRNDDDRPQASRTVYHASGVPVSRHHGPSTGDRFARLTVPGKRAVDLIV
ncbi:hypothetical protein Q31b_36090 [Novipirellula aureliae]|uniref:Uncharacterized protein n=1 Tax=Novipirellula aureliae TaxID=2527966 RepID=A0A5C6DSE8_9BACT|nr:hypothetical protein [Novipirellula aureliae]TWU40263.1 hypothetical protein Q31b_36090 [Novipirellula aureliae]